MSSHNCLAQLLQVGLSPGLTSSVYEILVVPYCLCSLGAVPILQCGQRLQRREERAGEKETKQEEQFFCTKLELDAYLQFGYRKFCKPSGLTIRGIRRLQISWQPWQTHGDVHTA